MGAFVENGLAVVLPKLEGSVRAMKVACSEWAMAGLGVIHSQDVNDVVVVVLNGLVEVGQGVHCSYISLLLRLRVLRKNC